MNGCNKFSFFLLFPYKILCCSEALKSEGASGQNNDFDCVDIVSVLFGAAGNVTYGYAACDSVNRLNYLRLWHSMLCSIQFV